MSAQGAHSPLMLRPAPDRLTCGLWRSPLCGASSPPGGWWGAHSMRSASGSVGPSEGPDPLARSSSWERVADWDQGARLSFRAVLCKGSQGAGSTGGSTGRERGQYTD
jgi:hypothetical protein